MFTRPHRLSDHDTLQNITQIVLPVSRVEILHFHLDFLHPYIHNAKTGHTSFPLLVENIRRTQKYWGIIS